MASSLLFLRKWFQERMYFLSCWKTVFREKFCSFNWKLSSFSIPYSFNPIKVIVMLLEQFQQKSDFWVACVRQQYLTIFIWLLTIQSSVNTKSDCLYMKKVYNILTRADGINMLQQVGGNKWNVDNNTII